MENKIYPGTSLLFSTSLSHRSQQNGSAQNFLKKLVLCFSVRDQRVEAERERRKRHKRLIFFLHETVPAVKRYAKKPDKINTLRLAAATIRLDNLGRVILLYFSQGLERKKII